MKLLLVRMFVLITAVFLVGCSQQNLDNLPIVDDTTPPEETNNSENDNNDDTQDEDETDNTQEPSSTTGENTTGQLAEDNEATDTDATTLTVLPAESRLGREARKVGGKHWGTVDFSEGTILLDSEGNLAGGEFVADMTTITLEDVDNEMLLNHLKSDDFFDVSNHAESTLVITDVQPGTGENDYLVTADMTIKGITNEIEFPATLVETENGVEATANFQVDRTRWDITFRSLRYFSDIADKAIDDMYDYEITIVATE